jgi:hypothetical protein
MKISRGGYVKVNSKTEARGVQTEMEGEVSFFKPEREKISDYSDPYDDNNGGGVC